jgi:hypothetical protein
MFNALIKILLFLVGSLVLLGVSANAEATTVNRTILQLATGVCDANNPANDPNLRRLPNGLKNASAGSVSVVCSQWGDDNTASFMAYAVVWFKNEKAAGATVNCTLSAGTPFYGQTAITKSVYVAGGAEGSVTWDFNDYGFSSNMQWVNLQCSLPAGWSMRDIYFSYAEEVGA